MQVYPKFYTFLSDLWPGKMWVKQEFGEAMSVL
jgi:hypothetical protein